MNAQDYILARRAERKEKVEREEENARDFRSFRLAVYSLHDFLVIPESCGSFTHALFMAIQHADYTNRDLLAEAYPFEVLAYEAWLFSKDSDGFFRRYGIEPFHPITTTTKEELK